ncbi:helix-turn-helix transcriptional regulator [Nocardioides sp. GY 10127]|uniref:helix-turn-helix domain-containing protein n=1 Tax=Nocardioides sp. GY 10127 TaxID=2569762 RepID=UPI0010A90138|nr:helix-turn-helix transcriptional regulator [Nocardioides sp. GY 10127]TIC80161.1 helix-turn-helix transcriptional regulator [Nocardioides sp. GY 10127]
MGARRAQDEGATGGPPAVASTLTPTPAPGDEDGTQAALEQVGPRLRQLRLEREATLADLSAETGISVSTLSRLESGQRKPTLELLLPLARAHRVALDELVDAPETGDPRVRLTPLTRHGRTYLPLTRRPGGVQAFKMVIPVEPGEPGELRTHDGYEWMYVLSGRVRLVLGSRDLLLGPGEVVEFDTRTPHWFGNPGPHPAEVLALYGPQGERMHVRS